MRPQRLGSGDFELPEVSYDRLRRRKLRCLLPASPGRKHTKIIIFMANLRKWATLKGFRLSRTAPCLPLKARFEAELSRQPSRRVRSGQLQQN